MKFCQKCGRENQDDAKFCVGCGIQFDQEQNQENDVFEAQYPKYEQPIKSKSSMGTVSMILGIISVGLLCLCCCCPVSIITGPIAIITGIIYIVKNPTESKGKAIAGLVLGIVATVLSIILFISLPEIMESVRETALDTCFRYPDSEECHTYKETFPFWFN